MRRQPTSGRIPPQPAAMSDSDEPYDADGDVSRFLHCPSPEHAHMFSLSEPEATLVGLCQYAPAATTDGRVHQAGHQAPPPPQTLNVPTTEFQGLPVPAPVQTLNAAAPDFGLHQQAPITGLHQGHPAPQTTLGVAPDFGRLQQQAPPTTGFQGHPAALMQTPNPAPNFGGLVPFLPAIDAAAEHYQASSIMDVDHYRPMAMENIPPAAQMLAAAPEMHHHAASSSYGGLPDPTPMHCDGVDGASLHMLANGGVIPDPSPASLYQQLVNDDGQGELAAIVRDIERRMDDNNAGAAALNDDDVYPVFRPIIRGQLDCSRCRLVRGVVVRQDERRKMHFMVHASDPGMTFQHAIIDRMSIGADGHFHTDDVLLHHDLRGRNPEWVHDFIARSVEMMKRNPGQMQGTCSSSYDRAAAVGIAAPPLSRHHHAHMELEVNMLNNILSAPAAATATAARPAVTQEQDISTTNNAPVVPEAAAPEAAQPVVVAPQEHTDAPHQGVEAEAAVSEEAAHQPAGVTAPPQEQESTDAPPATTAVTSHEEENKDNAAAGAVFASFNWEGFRPEILESSLVEPYGPAESGSGGTTNNNVLLYPSLVEQLRQVELERKDRNKRLSKMPAQEQDDTTASAYLLQMSGEDDPANNEPKLGSSAAFRRLCQRDATYRIYSRRVNCINRKMTKLQQSAARVGPKGLFAVKQKMETYRQEKAALYDMINKAMQENERGGGNSGAGPSNSKRAAGREAAGTSNDDAAAAGPSNTAAAIIPSSDDGAAAGISDDAAGPSDTAKAPSSNCAAGPSGSIK